MNSDRVKGYFFATVGTVTFASIYVFSKAALNEVHLAQFGVYWYFIALSLNLAWLITKGHHKMVPRLSKKQWRTLGILGILEILTATTFFLSIHIITDPAVTSFIGNLYPVILTTMGVVFLRERFTRWESFGGFLAIAGAFVISYQGGTTLANLFIPGAGVVLINAFLASTASMVVKINVKHMTPELLNTNLSLWLFVFSLVMFIVYGQSFTIPVSAFTNIAIGATFGAFIGILTIYYSFMYIEVSKSSIIQSLKGIFVLGGGYLYFQTLPLPHQLVGGAVTIAGVLTMSMSRAGFFGRKQ